MEKIYKKCIPIVVVENVLTTLQKIDILYRKGIKYYEITLRNEFAYEVIEKLVAKYDDIIVGAGTVFTLAQCEKVISLGVKFVVSPTFSLEVFNCCKSHSVLYIPGVATPTEIYNAYREGIKLQKLFPIDLFGGLKAVKTYKSVFSDIMFMPTGGIDINNMREFLKQDNVYCVGGSFMMKGNLEDINITIVKMQEMEEL